MIKWLTINKGINRVKPIQDSSYWTGIIAALDKQVADTGAAIAALAEKKKPLCLAAHLGCKKSLAEIEKIGIESRQLSAGLPNLKTAREQAQAALQAAQQVEQHAANIAKAELMRDATFARLELCGKIDAAVIHLTDLLLEDISQREKFSSITGVQFRTAQTYSLIRSALAHELLVKRSIAPNHHALRLDHVDYRPPATNTIWCQGWLESVNRGIDLLIDNDPAHKSLSIEETEIELQKAA